MTRLSTKTHGIIDLMTVGTLLALPRAMGWSECLTSRLTKVALGSLGYSMLTDYEFGLLRVLPMRAHLALDAASGAMLCATPWMFPEEDRTATSMLMGIGLFELGAAFTTRPEPSDKEERQAARMIGESHRWPTDSRYAEEHGRSPAESML